MEQENTRRALFWFRRDLRLNDNVGLYHALKECDHVAPIFIFDKTILQDLASEDRRVEFILKCLSSLKSQLNLIGSDILVKYAVADNEIVNLAKTFKVSAVYVNEDYEPQARVRDANIQNMLAEQQIEFKSYKDTVIFGKDDLLNGDLPYITFTQYKSAWKKKLKKESYTTYSIENYKNKFAQFKSKDLITLKELGFKKSNLDEMKLVAGNEGALILFNKFKEKFLPHYKILKDIPFAGGASYLSVHNRFGTISIRFLLGQIISLMKIYEDKRKESCETWLNELIWREFYMQLLYHYPHLVSEPFRQEFNNFPWENNPLYYIAWCKGKTGFPLIDAAMIQLNKTGYMHGRLRMLVSSFLTKHLLTDYRLGEQYFASNLLDYDLSANNGGWQWAASSGCEAQSYIKIFNPIKQSEKFDGEARFIKKYLPIFKNVPAKYLHEPWVYEKELKELGIELGKDYPKPIIDHNVRRKIALDTFSEEFAIKK